MSSAGRPSVSTIGGRFKKLGKIGEGSFGDVFKALDTETNEVVAVKVINLEEAEEEIEEIREEITMLSECQSPYVTRYITSYTNGPELCIAMEYLGGGSVHDLLDDGPLDENYVGIITRELLKACDYLHSNGKIHRDIKAANILLSSKGDVKLSDFGVTAKLTNTIQKRNTFVGTPFWMAPEVIKQSDYNQSADIWSIGITVIEMFVGHPPFHDVHPMKALFLIPKADPPSLEAHPTASKALKEFVALCCQKDAAKRPTVKALLSSKFVRNAKKNSALQELLMEKQMKAEASSKRNGTSRSQGVNEDEFGDEMTVVEEEVDTQDGDDSWSFTVKQPSATAAAQKAKQNNADVGTVRGVASTTTSLASPSNSNAVLGRPSVSHVHSLAPGLPIPSPSSGTMHSGLTNTITKTTRYDSNTVRGGDLPSEGDVSSGSGSDDDNNDDDEDDGMGTVRMVGKSSKYSDDIDLDDDADQRSNDAQKNSLQNMFHRPSITGETTPPKPQPPAPQQQQPPQPSPPVVQQQQAQPPVPAPVPIPSSLPPPTPATAAAVVTSTPVAPSSSKNTPLHSASNSPASSTPTTPVLAARSVPPPVKSATFHPGTSNHSNNNSSMTNFSSAVARAATLFNSMHSNSFPAVATATQNLAADLDALEAVRAGLGAEFLRFCVASLDAGVSRPASPSIKPAVPPKPLFNLNTSSPSSSPAASPVLQSNSNTPIVPPTPLTAITTPAAGSTTSSPAPMARRDSKPPMSAFYQQSPQQQQPAASPAAAAPASVATTPAAAAASPAASPAAAPPAVSRQTSFPSSSPASASAGTSNAHPPIVASGSATVGPAASKSSIFSNARSMWQQKEEQAKQQQQQLAGPKVVPPHLRNMSK